MLINPVISGGYVIFPQDSTQFVKTLPSSYSTHIHIVWIMAACFVYNLVDEIAYVNRFLIITR